jgi:hypothetical protein
MTSPDGPTYIAATSGSEEARHPPRKIYGTVFDAGFDTALMTPVEFTVATAM